MGLTENLNRGHDFIRSQMGRIEELASLIDSAEEGKDTAKLFSVMISNHVRLEEEILFAEMDKDSKFKESLSAMRSEHDEILHMIQETLGMKNSSELVTALRLVLKKAKEHLAREEQFILQAANRTPTGGS